MKRLFSIFVLILCFSLIIYPDDFGKLFVQNGEPFILDESKELFESPGLGWIFVDKNLDIYLPDYKAKNVKRYDKTGKLIMTYGRPGKGPGEFEFPVKVIVKNDLVLVNDFSRSNYSIFNKATGKFIKSEINIFNDIGLMLDPNGWIYTIGRSPNGKEMIYRMNDDLTVHSKFFKPEVLTKVPINTSPFLFIDFDASNNIYVGLRTSYKIAVYDKNLNLKKVFGEPGKNWKQLTEIVHDTPEKPDATDKAKSKHTFLVDIYVLKNKYLLVMKTIIGKKDAYHFDLYTLSGKKLYEDIFYERFIVGRDHLYNIYVYSEKETADDTLRSLCRYRLKDDIK